MSRRWLLARAAVVLVLVTVVGCETVDLKTAVQITDVSSGYYDAGLTDAGLNKLVPSLTFAIRNADDKPLSSIDVIVMYWQDGKDSEMDESVVTGIGGSGLPPGASGCGSCRGGGAWRRRARA